MKIEIFFILCCFFLSMPLMAEKKLLFPQAVPTKCSVPADLRGREATEYQILELGKKSRILESVNGGCGEWKLTKEDIDKLPELLITQLKGYQPTAVCEINKHEIDTGPFGTRIIITCSKKLLPEDGKTEQLLSYLTVDIQLDTDGEAVIVFVSSLGN